MELNIQNFDFLSLIKLVIYVVIIEIISSIGYIYQYI